MMTMTNLERTLKKVATQIGEDVQSQIKRPLDRPGNWKTLLWINGNLYSGAVYNCFGYECDGFRYVYAKSWIEAREMAQRVTGITNIEVTHPDFSGIL